MNLKVLPILIISIALVGYDFYDQRPKRLGGITSQQTSNQTLVSDLATAKEAQSKIGKVKEDIKNTELQVSELLERLPKKSQAGALLEQITTISANKNIRFESVTPTSTTPKTANVVIQPGGVGGKVSYEEMGVSLELTTGFTDLGKYLENLEQVPRLIDVVGLMLKSTSPGKPLNVKMNIKTYIYGG